MSKIYVQATITPAHSEYLQLGMALLGQEMFSQMQIKAGHSTCSRFPAEEPMTLAVTSSQVQG